MYCKKCNQQITDDSLFCPYCGAKAEDESKSCKKCGNNVPDDSDFCPFCGEKIVEERANHREDNNDSNASGTEDNHETIENTNPHIKSNERKIVFVGPKSTKSIVYIGQKDITKKKSTKDKLAKIIRKGKEKISNNKKVLILTAVSFITLVAILGTVFAVISKKQKNNTDTKVYHYSFTNDSMNYTEENGNTFNKDSTGIVEKIREENRSKSDPGIVEEIREENRRLTTNKNESNSTQDAYDRLESKYSLTSDYYEQTSSYYEPGIDYATTKPITTKPAPFKTLSYSGNGRDSVKRINLPQGEYYIICNYSGKHNFIAHFHSSTSESYGDLIANFVGSGSSIYGYFGEASNGYIDVDAEGSWTITIEKCQTNNKGTTLKYNGNGTSGIKNINLPDGEYYITCSYSGEHNFIAYFYSSTKDNYGDLIANFVGSGNETYAFSGKVTNGYININSQGSWTVTIESA